jgi:hypothetical protein
MAADPEHELLARAMRINTSVIRMNLIFFIEFLFLLGLLIYYGTGSIPPGLKGLHRMIRQAARKPPLRTPYL